jgi:hypothetical protein
MIFRVMLVKIVAVRARRLDHAFRSRLLDLEREAPVSWLREREEHQEHERTLRIEIAVIDLIRRSFATAILPAQTRQGEVAARGAKVMPFDLDQTTHVFQKLDDGGLQKVVVKDPSNKNRLL